MRKASASVVLARLLLPALLLGGLYSAHASSPVATYVVPSKLEFMPDEATATRVVIHGAFFFWQKDGTYNQPACGYMYFACPAGQEKMCRMQWTELNNAIGLPQCEGFGQQMMQSQATLRSEGTTPANPDTWDLGIGITPGSFVGGQCAPAQALKCPLPSAQPDMATPPTPTPDLSAPAVGPPVDPSTGKTGGCAMAGPQAAMGGALTLLAGAVTALWRRRRRG